jgi:2-methylcitrate dehydratase PrpD
MSKVNVIMDETIPERGEYCPVTIELKDGRKFAYTATIQKGHAKNPLTEDEVLDKFRSNITVMISKERGEEIIACVRALDTLGNLGELTKLMVP